MQEHQLHQLVQVRSLHGVNYAADNFILKIPLQLNHEVHTIVVSTMSLSIRSSCLLQNGRILGRRTSATNLGPTLCRLRHRPVQLFSLIAQKYASFSIGIPLKGSKMANIPTLELNDGCSIPLVNSRSSPSEELKAHRDLSARLWHGYRLVQVQYRCAHCTEPY